ncbi:Hypothetical predicted protein, partial [Xyrichtys novacula]
ALGPGGLSDRHVQRFNIPSTLQDTERYIVPVNVGSHESELEGEELLTTWIHRHQTDLSHVV